MVIQKTPVVGRRGCSRGRGWLLQMCSSVVCIVRGVGCGIRPSGSPAMDCLDFWQSVIWSELTVVEVSIRPAGCNIIQS